MIMGVICVIFCLPMCIVILYNIITSVLKKKVLEKGKSLLGANNFENIVETTQNAHKKLYGKKSGGGKHFDLNNPKSIILIVFFIFIIYNGSRNTGTHRRKSYNINNRCN